MISDMASGAISAVTKSGTGTWTLTGANTYTGATKINGGILSINTIKNVSGGSSALGAPSTVANGTIAIGTTTTAGTLTYTGTGDTSDRVINLAGTTGGATIDQSGTSGLLKFTSALTATGVGAKTLTLQGSTAGTGEIGGAIVDSSSGATAINKDGTGTWTLSGNNTFNGAVTITAGKLIITTSTALGVGTKTIDLSNGSVGDCQLHLDGSGGNIIIGSTISYKTSWAGGTIWNDAGNNAIQGNISMYSGGGDTTIISTAGKLTISGNITATATGRNLRLRGDGNGEISGIISDGSTPNLPVYKESGTGTWILSGANTYDGATTVSSGTLLVNGDQSSANGTVSVASGATLGGSGTIGGNITISSGGTNYPGIAGTPTKLTVKGNVSFSGTAPCLTINTSGTTSYDQIDCANTAGKTFTCTNGRLLLPSAPPTALGSIKIVTNAVSGGIVGQFSNASGTALGENASLSSYTGWSDWYIHYRPSLGYVELNKSSTPVVLLQLQALTVDGKVTVRWSTSSESKTAGFDLYRVVNGQSVKLNDTLIAAKGWPNGGIGASYSVADAGAQPGQTYTYKLVERTTDGQSIDYGPYDRTVSEFVMKPLEVTAAGAKVRWLSRTGEIYRVLKSTDLTSGQYQPIAENIAATPPENEHVDTNPG
ncbi:MAG: autotransporter-associated beta strand repeat-containing protein, partial [Kiritimatiellaeota bacterium]|nr:autotransporter-associated beta strand repeat-containing protein [Kiritimatiellota bacterium]